MPLKREIKNELNRSCWFGLNPFWPRYSNYLSQLKYFTSVLRQLCLCIRNDVNEVFCTRKLVFLTRISITKMKKLLNKQRPKRLETWQPQNNYFSTPDFKGGAGLAIINGPLYWNLQTFGKHVISTYQCHLNVILFIK